jgi:hypothetical protein
LSRRLRLQAGNPCCSEAPYPLPDKKDASQGGARLMEVVEGCDLDGKHIQAPVLDCISTNIFLDLVVFFVLICMRETKGCNMQTGVDFFFCL